MILAPQFSDGTQQDRASDQLEAPSSPNQLEKNFQNQKHTWQQTSTNSLLMQPSSTLETEEGAGGIMISSTTQQQLQISHQQHASSSSATVNQRQAAIVAYHHQKQQDEAMADLYTSKKQPSKKKLQKDLEAVVTTGPQEHNRKQFTLQQSAVGHFGTNPNNSYFKKDQKLPSDFAQLQQIYFNFNNTNLLSGQMNSNPAVKQAQQHQNSHNNFIAPISNSGEQQQQLSYQFQNYGGGGTEQLHYQRLVKQARRTIKTKSKMLHELQKIQSKQAIGQQQSGGQQTSAQQQMIGGSDLLLTGMTKSRRLLSIDELPSNRSSLSNSHYPTQHQKQQIILPPTINNINQQQHPPPPSQSPQLWQPKPTYRVSFIVENKQVPPHHNHHQQPSMPSLAAMTVKGGSKPKQSSNSSQSQQAPLSRRQQQQANSGGGDYRDATNNDAILVVKGSSGDKLVEISSNNREQRRELYTSLGVTLANDQIMKLGGVGGAGGDPAHPLGAGNGSNRDQMRNTLTVSLNRQPSWTTMSPPAVSNQAETNQAFKQQIAAEQQQSSTNRLQSSQRSQIYIGKKKQSTALFSNTSKKSSSNARQSLSPKNSNSDIQQAMIQEQDVEETKETLLNYENYADYKQESSDGSNEEYNFKKFQDLIQQIEYISKQENEQFFAEALSSERKKHQKPFDNVQEFPGGGTAVRQKQHRRYEKLNQVLMPLKEKKRSVQDGKLSLIAKNSGIGGHMKDQFINSSRQVVMTKIKEMSGGSQSKNKTNSKNTTAHGNKKQSLKASIAEEMWMFEAEQLRSRMGQTVSTLKKPNYYQNGGAGTTESSDLFFNESQSQDMLNRSSVLQQDGGNFSSSKRKAGGKEKQYANKYVKSMNSSYLMKDYTDSPSHEKQQSSTRAQQKGKYGGVSGKMAQQQMYTSLRVTHKPFVGNQTSSNFLQGQRKQSDSGITLGSSIPELQNMHYMSMPGRSSDRIIDRPLRGVSNHDFHQNSFTEEDCAPVEEQLSPEKLLLGNKAAQRILKPKHNRIIHHQQKEKSGSVMAVVTHSKNGSMQLQPLVQQVKPVRMKKPKLPLIGANNSNTNSPQKNPPPQQTLQSTSRLSQIQGKQKLAESQAAANANQNHFNARKPTVSENKIVISATQEPHSHQVIKPALIHLNEPASHEFEVPLTLERQASKDSINSLRMSSKQQYQQQHQNEAAASYASAIGCIEESSKRIIQHGGNKAAVFSGTASPIDNILQNLRERRQRQKMLSSQRHKTIGSSNNNQKQKGAVSNNTAQQMQGMAADPQVASLLPLGKILKNPSTRNIHHSNNSNQKKQQNQKDSNNAAVSATSLYCKDNQNDQQTQPQPIVGPAYGTQIVINSNEQLQLQDKKTACIQKKNPPAKPPSTLMAQTMSNYHEDERATQRPKRGSTGDSQSKKKAVAQQAIENTINVQVKSQMSARRRGSHLTQEKGIIDLNKDINVHIQGQNQHLSSFQGSNNLQVQQSNVNSKLHLNKTQSRFSSLDPGAINNRASIDSIKSFVVKPSATGANHSNEETLSNQVKDATIKAHIKQQQIVQNSSEFLKLQKSANQPFMSNHNQNSSSVVQIQGQNGVQYHYHVASGGAAAGRPSTNTNRQEYYTAQSEFSLIQRKSAEGFATFDKVETELSQITSYPMLQQHHQVAANFNNNTAKDNFVEVQIAVEKPKLSTTAKAAILNPAMVDVKKITNVSTPTKPSTIVKNSTIKPQQLPSTILAVVDQNHVSAATYERLQKNPNQATQDFAKYFQISSNGSNTKRENCNSKRQMAAQQSDQHRQ